MKSQEKVKNVTSQTLSITRNSENN